jgi:hypothetical protein
MYGLTPKKAVIQVTSDPDPEQKSESRGERGAQTDSAGLTSPRERVDDSRVREDPGRLG